MTWLSTALKKGGLAVRASQFAVINGNYGKYRASTDLESRRA
jgi:hypothetical protein